MRSPLAICALAILVGLSLALGAVAADDEGIETIELIPEDPAGVGATHLHAPISGLFLGGPGYWYSPRRVKIETTPPGAVLDLFYVRRNFQKGYEQADAPVRVVLPSRIEAGKRDSLTIRAFLEGYRQQEVSIKVRSRQEEVMIDLEPLSNSLVAVTHLYFADRSSLGFLTKEALTFRLQKRNDETYSLVLVETGGTSKADADMEVVRDALVGSVRGQQLGEDLAVQIALEAGARDGQVDIRSRQGYDPVRRVHSFYLDLTPTGGPSSVQRAKNALARIRYAQVFGCARRFDQELRAQLDPADLARALTPAGAFTDPYLRAAMKRLGEISPGGAVVLADGSEFRTAIPLELAAAASQSAEVKGYLAMLRQFVSELEEPGYRRAILRGLLAPELAPKRWDEIIDAAESAERSCKAV